MGDGGGELCFLSAPSSVINDTLEEILSFDVKRCGIGVLFSLRPILVSGKQLTRANEFIGVGLNVSWEKNNLSLLLSYVRIIQIWHHSD